MWRYRYMVCAFAIYLLAALVSQWSMDAWHEEFGGHADEAAHYVTALMVRDYVADGFPGAPMAYARNYYVHYPKVALGHWPPLFYGVMLPWILAFEAARTPLMLFMAITTALLAMAVRAVGMRLLGRTAGFLAGWLLLGFPLLRMYGGMLMSDILNALLCFLAALWFGLFLDGGRRRDALVFGVLAVAAILNKGTAIGLALVPPLGVLMTRRWSLLRRPAFWCPALLVAVICTPWYWMVLPMMIDGFENPQGLASSLYAVAFYSRAFGRLFGPALLLLAAWGAFTGVAAGRRRGIWAGLVALALATPLFHCVVTNAFDARYLLPVLPAMMILLLGGARNLVRFARRGAGVRNARLFTGGLVAILLVGRFADPPRLLGLTGYGMPAADLRAHAPFDGWPRLISSDARGEGAFIAQTALRDRRPEQCVLRASKALAGSLWDGREYRARFNDGGELRDFLLSVPVGVVVVDATIPAERQQPHHRLLAHTMREYPAHFREWNTYPVRRDGVFYPRGLVVYAVEWENGRRPPPPSAADLADIVWQGTAAGAIKLGTP